MPRKTRRRVALQRVRIRKVTSFARRCLRSSSSARNAVERLRSTSTSKGTRASRVHPQGDRVLLRPIQEGELGTAALPVSWLGRFTGLGFEATPDYLFYPPTPERVADVFRTPASSSCSGIRSSGPTRTTGTWFAWVRGPDLRRAAMTNETHRSRRSGGAGTRSALPLRDLLRFSYATEVGTRTSWSAGSPVRSVAVPDPAERGSVRGARGHRRRRGDRFLGYVHWRPRVFHNFSREPGRSRSRRRFRADPQPYVAGTRLSPQVAGWRAAGTVDGMDASDGRPRAGVHDGSRA